METIELDCAPGTPRPDDLLPGILEGTGLTPDDFVITMKFFGWWRFELKPESDIKLFRQHKPVFEERIKALYKQGAIRAGSW
jgi:hypothetical protein